MTDVLLVAVLLGLIPALIARSKGRDFLLWWFYGAALFIVALPHSLILRADTSVLENEQLQSGEFRKCPFCAELIKAEAVVCRFCGRNTPTTDAKSIPPPIDADDALMRRLVEALEKQRRD